MPSPSVHTTNLGVVSESAAWDVHGVERVAFAPPSALVLSRVLSRHDVVEHLSQDEVRVLYPPEGQGDSMQEAITIPWDYEELL